MQPASSYDSFLATQFEKLSKEIASPDWTSEKKTKFYELFLRQGETSKTVKVCGTFNSSAKKIRDFFMDPKTLTQYDDSKESREELEAGPNYKAFYTKGVKVFMVDPRDTVIVVGFKEESNGTIVIAGGSVEHPKIPSEIKGRVRACAEIVGYVLEPLKEDPNKCKFIYCGKLDPKGSVPGMVVNKMLMKQGEIMEKMDQCAAKY